MSIVKTTAALIVAAASVVAIVPAQAQSTAMPGVAYEQGAWINSANRDYYSGGPVADDLTMTSDDFASTACTTGHVRVHLRDGRTVVRLRHICP